MNIFEFDQQMYIKVQTDEAREDGRAEGRAEGEQHMGSRDRVRGGEERYHKTEVFCIGKKYCLNQ